MCSASRRTHSGGCGPPKLVIISAIHEGPDAGAALETGRLGVEGTELAALVGSASSSVPCPGDPGAGSAVIVGAAMPIRPATCSRCAISVAGGDIRAPRWLLPPSGSVMDNSGSIETTVVVEVAGVVALAGAATGPGSLLTWLTGSVAGACCTRGRDSGARTSWGRDSGARTSLGTSAAGRDSSVADANLFPPTAALDGSPGILDGVSPRQGTGS